MSASTDLRLGNQPLSGSGELFVSEIFGQTFQGEGPSIGRRCSFLRLGGCNLHCAWCDSPYTWDWSGRNGLAYDPAVELRRLTVASIWKDLAARHTDMLVVSGGEPLLQAVRLVPLLQMARRAGWRLEVETAATVNPGQEVIHLVDSFNVSPKLANSGNGERTRVVDEVLAGLSQSGKAVWKFVVVDAADLEEVDRLVTRFGLAPVYVMPEGVTEEEIMLRTREIASEVLARGWNLTTRLQVLMYGNRRGV